MRDVGPLMMPKVFLSTVFLGFAGLVFLSGTHPGTAANGCCMEPRECCSGSMDSEAIYAGCECCVGGSLALHCSQEYSFPCCPEGACHCNCCDTDQPVWPPASTNGINVRTLLGCGDPKSVPFTSHESQGPGCFHGLDSSLISKKSPLFIIQSSFLC